MREKSRFTDEVGERYGELSIGVVKFYNDGAVPVVIRICA